MGRIKAKGKSKSKKERQKRLITKRSLKKAKNMIDSAQNLSP